MSNYILMNIRVSKKKTEFVQTKEFAYIRLSTSVTAVLIIAKHLATMFANA